MYFLLWIIYFGSVTVESVLFGLGIAAVIFAFTCAFLDQDNSAPRGASSDGHGNLPPVKKGWRYYIRKELSIYKRIPGMLQYVFVLVWEIVKANLAVIHMILSEEEELQPVIVNFHSDLQTPTGQAFLANAITLTPGTITVSLENGDYVVHCLDEDLADGMETSICAQLISDLEK